ncbi:60S ribosomal protein L36 [Citrus sinensis]|uniref:60S ribosomal protein L36 n=1 Tax=Citrus sinensis TaxID=2711 RepID=A0ACB8L9R5_CITSI|nr:60S ribosomal protein L36 [Citrus sinensis]
MHGHIVTKKELLPRPVDRKGKTSKRVHFERNVIGEVSGFAPYEKRIDALLKRKLCTYERAKMKHGEMSNVLCRTRATGGGKKKK